MKKTAYFGLILAILFLTGCAQKGRFVVDLQIDTEQMSNIEKGIDLPVDPEQCDNAKHDLDEIINMYGQELCLHLDEKTGQIDTCMLEEIVSKLGDKKYIVKSDNEYANIENWEEIDGFLSKAKEGRKSQIVLYEIHSNGDVGRYLFYYNGSAMFVFYANMILERNGIFAFHTCRCTRIKNWRYTSTGWFCYQLCVPEYPQVSEVVDGSVLIRVSPISDEYRYASEKYVYDLGYQGNNILCSNWNQKNLDKLDYIGMYEYLYYMEYGERYQFPQGAKGIEAYKFETLIQKYIPVSVQCIRDNSAYDENNQVYLWSELGCMNYKPNFFGTSFPEVIKVSDHHDGTRTLTVNAVCEMMLNDEAVITHELTVRENEDGTFMYLGNEIVNGIQNIPEYQYRIK